MVRFTASTRQPPAGGLGSASELDELLEGLRRGERDGFVRYFDLFRTPVYGFALHLLHDEAAAVAATVQSLSAAFRRITLSDDEADLEALTYRCALDACATHVTAVGDDDAAGSTGGCLSRRRVPRTATSTWRWTLSRHSSARRCCCTTCTA